MKELQDKIEYECIKSLLISKGIITQEELDNEKKNWEIKVEIKMENKTPPRHTCVIKSYQ